MQELYGKYPTTNIQEYTDRAELIRDHGDSPEFDAAETDIPVWLLWLDGNFAGYHASLDEAIEAESTETLG